MTNENRPGNRGDIMLMGRFLAAVDQLAHTGMTEFQIAHDDDLGELSPVEVLWRAEGKWQGVRKFSAYFAYPAQAVEDLLSKIVNGGACMSCGRRVIVGMTIAGFCSRTLWAGDIDNDKSYKYVKACEGEKWDESKPKPTKLRLRDDLIAANAPAEMVQNAVVGWYDDYESPVAESILLLVKDAREAGLHDIAEAAKNGAYDGSKEESEVWIASPEGQEVLAEFPPEIREKLFGEVLRRADGQGNRQSSDGQGNRAQRRQAQREKHRRGRS